MHLHFFVVNVFPVCQHLCLKKAFYVIFSVQIEVIDKAFSRGF